jgi:hypothetical protein
MSDLAMPDSTTTSAPRDATYWLAILAAITTIALTAAAFWLSYEHLHDVAATHGLATDQTRAWAWPATVDLFIVIGELLILRASLNGTSDPWAITLTVIGSGGSIALNVAGVGDHAPALHYVVAAVPPVAALLAFGALMRQVHGVLAAPETGEQPAEPREQVELSRADTEQPVRDALSRPASAEQPAPWFAPPRETAEQPPAETGEQPERDRFLTSREVADRYGVELSTVGTWKQRGKITPALVDPRVGNLYDPETLPAAASTG